MNRPLQNRWLLAAAGLLAAMVIAIFIVQRQLPDPAIAPTLVQRQPDAARGEYLAILGDCSFCHTQPGGRVFAGGRSLDTPLGVLYSSNITPDADTGIGHYVFKDFVRVMRLGVTPSGTRLYPAMPYTAYAKVSDEDLQDLFAYLQTKIAPVHQASRVPDIHWPLSVRWPLALWSGAFLDRARFRTDSSKDAQWNRGAYLVQGLLHCGTCHTPRGVFYEEKDVSGSTNRYLSGTELDGNSPINLRGNEGDGLGRWSAADIADLLQSGRNGHSAVTGTMADVVRNSTQYMTDQDVAAVAGYLKSLSPASEDGRSHFAASEATLHTVMSGEERSTGGRIYMDSCAACHRLSGSGEQLAFPTLAGNPSVLSGDPSSLIAVILQGARAPSTAGAPTGLTMPGFDWRYDDGEIAELATFVRSSWGNQGGPVSAGQVTTIRERLGLSPPQH
jgi:mono/diheme cytochrome c family protein